MAKLPLFDDRGSSAEDSSVEMLRCRESGFEVLNTIHAISKRVKCESVEGVVLFKSIISRPKSPNEFLAL
jgi:hypothetical protein